MSLTFKWLLGTFDLLILISIIGGKAVISVSS